MSGYYLFLVCLFALGLIVSFILAFDAVARSRQERNILNLLEEQGETTTGQIISHRAPGNGSRRVRTFYITYSYEVKGKVHSNEQIVSKLHFNSWKDGKEVSVRYLPQAPVTTMLTGNDRDEGELNRQRTNTQVFIGIAAMSLVFLILFIIVLLKG